MTTFLLKTVSPDNDAEIRQVIDLFTDVYGDSYPYKGVYQIPYWRQHLVRRFTLLAAYHGEKIVALLGMQKEGLVAPVTQILFPLCSPDFISESDQIFSLLWSRIEVQAHRQQWRGIYYFSFAHLPEMTRIGEKILKVSSTALCQGYYPATNVRMRGNGLTPEYSSSNRTDIVVGQRFFSHHQDKMRTVHVLDEHKELVSHIYQTLQLKRQISTSAEVEKLSSYPLPADRLAIETRRFSHTGILHMYIEPSLLRSNSEIRDTLLDTSALNTCVFLKAYDPRAIDSAQWLLDNGFEFSGVLPFIHERESLLFSRPRENERANMRYAEDLLLDSRLAK